MVAIKINGQEGSREDIVLGELVTLSVDIEVTNYKWELIGKPYSSIATLSSISSPEVFFTPDVVGSYLIQLTINNKIKQRVVAAILTDRYGIRIPAAGEGEEIPGGSFKAITESIRILEEDSLNAAKIQGKDVSLNTPESNDLLRFNGTEWVPSNKLRTDNIGFSNSQNIFIKIPLSTAIPANSYWEYNAGTSSIKPHWKTVSGASPTLDISWNAFPHGSVLKKVYIIASCNNITSNQLTVKIEKNGAILNHSNQIISFIDQFVSTTEHTVSSPVVATLEIPENTEFNTEFTHGNSNDNTIVSEDLSIRLIADGAHEFKIFEIYVYFQTLSIGLYNGPLVAEGGGGEEGGGGTLDYAYDFGGDGAGRSITADTGAVEITTPVTSDNPCLTLNQNITDSVYPTILLSGETNQIYGDPVLDLMASEDITFSANSSEIIPFNSVTDFDLVGFTKTSVIGALNELKNDGPITYLETWDQVVGLESEVTGDVTIGVSHGMIYSLIIQSIGAEASNGADFDLADSSFSGSYEALYKIGLNGVDPIWNPSVNPVWKDRNPFGIEGLSGGTIYWKLSNYGSVEMTFRVTIRGMGWFDED